MKVVGGWPGRNVVGLGGRFGVLPAEFAALGDFPSPLLECVDPGDENTEFAWVVESLPGSGTVAANDDGGFSHVGAADGTYTTTARLYTWAPGGPAVDRGTFTITTIFGMTAAGRIFAASVSLLTGSAAGGSSSGATAPGRTLAVSIAMLPGVAAVPTIFRPTADVSAPGWVAQPAGPLYEQIDEPAPDDADYIHTAIAGAQPAVFLVGPLLPGTYTLRVRGSVTQDSGTITAKLLDVGGSTLATASAPLDLTPTTHEITLTFGAGVADRVSIEVSP